LIIVANIADTKDSEKEKILFDVTDKYNDPAIFLFLNRELLSLTLAGWPYSLS